MNYDKLNELAATRVMGWKLEVIREPNFSYEGYEDIQYWQPGNGEGLIKIESWSPATDANDALELIEIAAKKVMGWWECHQVTGYQVVIVDVNDKPLYHGEGRNVAEAFCVCALRAADVSESEIASALSTSEGASR